MPQFDASGIVEPLQVKLTPYAAFDGTITEPSDQQVGDFLNGLKTLFKDARESLGIPGDVDTSDTGQVMAAVEALEPGKYVAFQSEMAGLHADLCSGRPSKAELLAVPLRVRNLFYQWLQSEVMNPEAAPGGGSGAASPPPLRAAG